MNRFTTAVRGSIAAENWYAALTGALTLPDVCGYIVSPTATSKERYVAWFTEFVQPRYTHAVGFDMTEMTFLSGADCYALRCAYLHEGADTIAEQRAREALDRFVFLSPGPGGSGGAHCNKINNVLQLAVDRFCEDLCHGVDQWVAQEDPDRLAAGQARLIRIESGQHGFVVDRDLEVRAAPPPMSDDPSG